MCCRYGDIVSLQPGSPPSSPAWATPKRVNRTSSVVLAVVGILFGSGAVLLVALYLLVALGIPAVLVSALLALIPLSVVLLSVHWIDRWEPEPRAALWFAFLWGAGVAVALALLVDLGVEITAGAGADPSAGHFQAAVLQAPFVEEIAKGAGVLILALAVRRYFDSPVDGIVYAAVVAGGFAFSENIVYFGTTFVESGASGLGAVFVLRGVFSPFAHVMFTSCTGFAVGFAAQRYRTGRVLFAWVIGLIPAMFLHGLWNAAGFIVGDFLGYYLAVQVPLFAGAVVMVVLLRRHEVRITRRRLQEYADAGWFLPVEVTWLSTPSGRREARRWAQARSPHAGGLMKRFTADATTLAFARQRQVQGRGHLRPAADEAALLAAVTADRRAMLA